jgi:hypothetical protein
MTKGQIPNPRESIDASKTPKTVEGPGSYYGKFPAWRFSKADMEHEQWSVLEAREDDVIDDPDSPSGTSLTYKFSPSIDRSFLDGLMEREKAPWSTWMTQSGGRKAGTNSHNIPIHKLEQEAQQRATELNLDTDELFSLRLDGTKRVFGILEGDGILSVVWFDRNHKICPVNRS